MVVTHPNVLVNYDKFPVTFYDTHDGVLLFVRAHAHIHMSHALPSSPRRMRTSVLHNHVPSAHLGLSSFCKMSSLCLLVALCVLELVSAQSSECATFKH